MDPAQADFEQSLRRLRSGDYAEGFRLYESRLRTPAQASSVPALPLTRWQGEDISGKRLLIWPEQGAGDEIMFARFAFWLGARGVDVHLVSRRGLTRLLSGRGVSVLSLGESFEISGVDAWCMMGDLPRLIGVVSAEPYSAPYLAANPRRNTGRVGVVACGNPNFINDTNRSMDEAAARQLRSLPGAMSLDPRDTGARDYMETAEIIAGLDLVISVDTSVAHLAGAMGKPVWVLLPAIRADWCWGEGPERCAWYPSARLFRQTSPGDWMPLLDAVEARLGAHELCQD